MGIGARGWPGVFVGSSSPAADGAKDVQASLEAHLKLPGFGGLLKWPMSNGARSLRRNMGQS